MSATTAWLRTGWRGARVGFVGLALLGLPLATMGWYAAWRAAAHQQPPGIPLALGAPVFAAFYGLMAMALLSSMWMLMRKPAICRLAPRAERVMQRAMVGSGLGLWLFAGLPTVALLLAEAWLGSSRLPLGAALAWGLGVPLAGAALAAALIVLPAPPWMRWAAGALMWSLIGVPDLLHGLVEMAADARNATILGLGLAGLAGAIWTFKRVALALAAVASPSADGPIRPIWPMSRIREGFAGPLPRDTRWLVSPYRVGLRARDAAGISLVAMALLVLLPRLTGSPGPTVLFLTLIVAGTSVPWLVGAWVSPRWALLPGGLSRRTTAWRVLAGCLRSGAPRVAVVTLAFGLVALAGAEPSPSKSLAGLLVGAGLVVLSAGLAVASVPLFRSPQALALGPTLVVIVVVGACGVAERRLDEIAAGDFVTTLLLTGGLALALAAVGLLAVAASSRAWTRYDWSRMPAQPAEPGKLMRAGG